MPIFCDAAESNDSSLRVLLADDHIKILEIVQNLLSPDCRVVAAVHDGFSALIVAKALSPDLIVLDIEMPEMDGIRIAQELRRQGLAARILFLTVHDDEDYIAAARLCGNGYVLKSRIGIELHHAINEALSGRFFVSRRII